MKATINIHCNENDGTGDVYYDVDSDQGTLVEGDWCDDEQDAQDIADGMKDVLEAEGFEVEITKS